ncbi:unnamed protein product [Paramecium sonneborni]|uniref:Major facilitator superfamily (MFS) profile domain-containing protein n=1 Tax=Paramecium sonneborni TaxID=65129 RepID=A0A8S1PM98_9CILI|nr:unnamed protein product [Paramecium sonneborni]
MDKKQVSWHQTSLRWLFLAMTCIFQVGCCLCSDFPSVLASQMKLQFNIQQSDINQLFTFYSLPNVIFPFFGGIIIDKIGIRSSLVSFTAFLVFGQALCYYGSLILNYNYLKLGMMLMGMGGEICMSVAQSSIVSKWFVGQEMALAFGLKLTFTRLGSVLGVNLLRYTYVQFNESFQSCMMICCLIILIVWGVSFIQIEMDKISDFRDGQIKKDEEQSNVSLADIKQFKLDFYLVSLTCVLSYSAFIVLQQNCLQMFKIRYQLKDQDATFFYSLPYYISAIITPIFGGFVDKIGKRPLIILISGILLLISTSLYCVEINCINDTCHNLTLLAQSISGLSFAIFAPVIWPCIPLCISAKAQGTGFGVVTSIQNIGLSVLPLIVGQIIQDESQYSYVQMMQFIRIVTIFGTLCNIALYMHDKKSGNKLSAKQKKQKAE